MYWWIMKCEDYPMQCPPWTLAYNGPQPTMSEEENMLTYINNRRNANNKRNKKMQKMQHKMVIKRSRD